MHTLSKDGFQKFKIDKKKFFLLEKFLNNVKKITNNTLKKNRCNFSSLENFHNDTDENKNINDIKLLIIKKINDDQNSSIILFNILKNELMNLFGPDIAGQKNINLVIQRPFDKNYVNLHKDSPPNSPHEIVVWMPIVNCYKTMSFKFLNILHSKKIENMIKAESADNKILNYAHKNSTSIETNVGEFVIFWTGIYHYADLNKEKDTRWSINIRYKNLYSPYGMKGFADFFEPKSYSSISSLSLL